MQCRVKVLKALEGVYPSLHPEVGKVYDAEFHAYFSTGHRPKELAVITINNKLIALRRGEFERVG